jgi:hypothetical protein
MRLAALAPLLLLSGCAGATWLPEWLGGEPEWARRTGLRTLDDRVEVVGRSQERFGFKEAVEGAIHDGHRQLAEAIAVRVEAETVQSYEVETGSRLGARISGHFKTDATSRALVDLPGVEVEDTWSRVLRTDARGREVIEAAARVSIPRKDFEEAGRRAAEAMEAKLLDDRDLAFGLAEVAFEKGEPARALKLLDGLLRRTPGDVRSRLFRAQVLEKEGMTVEARTEYAIVARLDPRGAAGIAAAEAIERMDAPPAAEPPPEVSKAPSAPTAPAIAPSPAARLPAPGIPETPGTPAPPPAETPSAAVRAETPPAPAPVEDDEPRAVARHSRGVLSIAWSRDGTLLASASRFEDRTIRVVRAADGMLVDRRIGVAPVAFSHGGALLAYGAAAGGIVLVDLTTGKSRWSSDAHQGVAEAAAFSADDRFIFTGGGRSIRRWRVADGGLDGAAEEPGEINGLAYNALEGVIATASLARTVRILRADGAMEALASFESPHDPKCAALALDGSRVAFGTWEAAFVTPFGGGVPPAILPGHTGWVWSIAFGSDGETLATGDAAGTMRIWSLGDRAILRTVRAHEGEVYALAFAPGGRLLASGGADGAVKVLRVR